MLASDMLEYWTSKSEITSTADDLRTLSLHVLSRAGFGKSFKFEGHDERQGEQSASGNYKESLQTILENLVLILGLGFNLLGSPWLPKKLNNVHKACVSFQKHMTDLYEEEKRRLQQGEDSDHNLMTGLIRSSQDDPDGLTEKEVYGNMFAFNFAGHDTTAHTFTFAMFFLAANPYVQDWISEEIRFVVGNQKLEDWDYRACFPRLKRCLAVMYETLRLYTIVPAIKWTGHQEQEITIRGKKLILPPDSMVAPSYGAVQTDPRFWGNDSLTWKPSRWIRTTSGPADEEFIHPDKGTFIGWSEGSRDCPGRKFSQVEFVATMAVLFLNWRVEPLPAEGKSMHTARRRLLDMIENDSGYVLLLQILHPERANLRWKKHQM
jgi:cytochrome P450